MEIVTKNSQELVCEFSLAERLLELGIELNTFFYYIRFPNTGKYFLHRNVTALKNYNRNISKGIECDLIPAPLSEELGNIMPGQYEFWWDNLTVKGEDQKIWFFRKIDPQLTEPITASARKESNARAKLLVHLLENNMIALNE